MIHKHWLSKKKSLELYNLTVNYSPWLYSHEIDVYFMAYSDLGVFNHIVDNDRTISWNVSGCKDKEIRNITYKAAVKWREIRDRIEKETGIRYNTVIIKWCRDVDDWVFYNEKHSTLLFLNKEDGQLITGIEKTRTKNHKLYAMFTNY